MRIRHPLIPKLAAVVGVGSLRLLFRTVRMDLNKDADTVHVYNPDPPERFLYCIWHDSLIPATFARKAYNAAALVSKHQDGSYLAEAMKRINIKTVRGSSQRGGAQAVKEIIDLGGRYHIAITPDGPRGPRRKVKSGIVFLASHTGQPIVPYTLACTREWRIQGSWTDMGIPKPFSTVFGRTSDPIRVPPNLSRDGINHYTALVEQTMYDLQAEVDRLARQGRGSRKAVSDRAARGRAA